MPSIVTDQEIQREIDTLRSLRRRSASGSALGPGALSIDPDLPPPPPPASTDPLHLRRDLSHSPTSPRLSSRSPTSPTTGGLQRSFILGNPISPSREREDPLLEVASSALPNAASVPLTGGQLAPTPSDDPTHLFWVPAHLHPELAPGEFRAFLKSYTQVDPGGGDEVGEGAAGGLERRRSVLVGGAGGLGRRSSMNQSSSLSSSPASSGSSLGRKRSMLSKQYHPRANDHIEDEAPPLPALGHAGNRGSIYGGRTGEQGLTLEDLQRLEEVADEAAKMGEQGDGEGGLGGMRDLLRRSLSGKGRMVDQSGESYGLDENDQPIILPIPGQILRRTARTKIRKTGLVGDGGGHRFPASRKGRTGGLALSGQRGADEEEDEEERRVSGGRRASDKSDESEDVHSGEGVGGAVYHAGERVVLSDEGGHGVLMNRRTSTGSTEESVLDSYADGVGNTSVESTTSTSSAGEDRGKYGLGRSTSPTQVIGDEEEEWHDARQQRTPTGSTYDDLDARRMIVGEPQSTERSRSRPSPPTSPESQRRQDGPYYQPGPYEQYTSSSPSSSTSAYQPPPPQPAQSQAQLSPAPGPEKSLRPQPSREALKQEIMSPVSPTPSRQSTLERVEAAKPEKEKKGGFFSKKDKDSKSKKAEKDKKDKEKDGFLGSLFSSKKKHDEPPPALKFSSAGPAAAAALLGTSKSAKSIGLTPGGVSPTAAGFSSYARYPIHVERAVYRLSHIKLANPRRPLYEQVLISNLMFWYLSIINRAQNAPATPATSTTSLEEKKAGEEKPVESVTERDAKARAARPPAVQPPVKGTPPQSMANGNANAHPNAETAKRMGLSRPDSKSGASKQRTAETPVRTPQYGMQLQMEDYQRPPAAAGPPQGYQQHGQHHSAGPPPGQQYPDQRQQHPDQRQQHPDQPRRQPSPVHPAGLASPSPQQGRPAQQPQRQAPPPLLIPSSQPHGDQRNRPVSPGYVPQGANPSEAMRRSQTERNSLATVSHEAPYAGQQRSVSPGVPLDRRPMTDGPPRSPRGPPDGRYPPHSGPQPGQVFQYPGGMSGGVQPGQVFSPPPGQVRPGQVFPPQVGQVFHHPQYTPAGGPNGGPYPGPPQQYQLPPGAMPPRMGQEQSWMRSGNPGPHPPQPRPGYPGPPLQRSNSGGNHAPDQYAPHHEQSRSVSASAAPPHGQGRPGPPGGGMTRSDAAYGLAAPVGGPRPPGRSSSPQPQLNQPPYNPYMRGPEPQGQQRGRSDDGHGHRQQVAPGMPYDGRR